MEKSMQMRPTIARIAAQSAKTRRIKKWVPPEIAAWKIVRGDKVQIMSGKEKGKRGVILKVYREDQRVLVEGLNLVKKHQKGISADQPGGMVTKEAPAGRRTRFYQPAANFTHLASMSDKEVHVSVVSLIDPVHEVPTRAKWGFLADLTKVRIAVKSGTIIPKPEILKMRRHPRPYAGPKDTAPDVAHKKTVSEQDDTLHAALRSLTILGDAGHVLENK